MQNDTFISNKTDHEIVFDLLLTALQKMDAVEFFWRHNRAAIEACTAEVRNVHRLVETAFYFSPELQNGEHGPDATGIDRASEAVDIVLFATSESMAGNTIRLTGLSRLTCELYSAVCNLAAGLYGNDSQTAAYYIRIANTSIGKLYESERFGGFSNMATYHAGMAISSHKKMMDRIKRFLSKFESDKQAGMCIGADFLTMRSLYPEFHNDFADSGYKYDDILWDELTTYWRDAPPTAEPIN